LANLTQGPSIGDLLAPPGLTLRSPRNSGHQRGEACNVDPDEDDDDVMQVNDDYDSEDSDEDELDDDCDDDDFRENQGGGSRRRQRRRHRQSVMPIVIRRFDYEEDADANRDAYVGPWDDED